MAKPVCLPLPTVRHLHPALFEHGPSLLRQASVCAAAAPWNSEPKADP